MVPTFKDDRLSGKNESRFCHFDRFFPVSKRNLLISFVFTKIDCIYILLWHISRTILASEFQAFLLSFDNEAVSEVCLVLFNSNLTRLKFLKLFFFLLFRRVYVFFNE